jgi:hypothetical protein
MTAANCTSFEECVDSKCILPSKSCTNDCNGNGTCSFISTYTGGSVSDCKLGDTQCSAVCSCNSDRRGATCDTSVADYVANQNLRLLLIGGLNNLTISQDADLASVTGWIQSAVSLSQNSGELTADALMLLTDVISTIVTQAAALSLPYNQVLRRQNVCQKFPDYFLCF